MVIFCFSILNDLLFFPLKKLFLIKKKAQNRKKNILEQKVIPLKNLYCSTLAGENSI